LSTRRGTALFCLQPDQKKKRRSGFGTAGRQKACEDGCVRPARRRKSVWERVRRDSGAIVHRGTKPLPLVDFHRERRPRRGQKGHQNLIGAGGGSCLIPGGKRGFVKLREKSQQKKKQQKKPRYGGELEPKPNPSPGVRCSIRRERRVVK